MRPHPKNGHSKDTRLWLLAGAVLLIGLVLYVWPREPAPVAPEPTTVADAAERIFAQDDIQFERPDWSGAEKSIKGAPRLSDWRIVERDIKEPKRNRTAIKLPSFNLPPFMELLIWTIIGGFVLFLIYGAVVALSGHGWPIVRTESPESATAGGAAVLLNQEQVIADAERLAAEGRFEEAVHALLLHSIGALRRQLGRKLATALTSREIVVSADLPPAGREALQDLVTRVEPTYFGQRTAGLADYEVCRALFESFTKAIATQR